MSAPRDPMSPPRDARNPDTIFVCLLLTASGIGQLASGAESGSVEALVPTWMLLGWSITLTAGAGITLAGVWWRSAMTGLLIETVGRIMLGPATFAYALAVLFAAPGSGAFISALLFALAFSSGWRLWQIHRDFTDAANRIRNIAKRQGDTR